MKIRTLSFLAASVMYVLAAHAAWAQGTPDGETPANEGVCDDLLGGTPGLYGLCVGFCEAQDCVADFDETTGEVTFASNCNPSSSRLLDNYNRRALPGDPPMPCVNVVAAGCQCWTEAEIDLIGGEGSSEFCEITGSRAILVAFVAAGGQELAFHLAASCFYREFTPFTIIRNIPLDLAGVLACRASIVEECASRGL